MLPAWLNTVEADPTTRTEAHRRGVLSERDYIAKHAPLVERIDKADGLGLITGPDYDDLHDDYWRACTAVLLDNSMRFLLNVSTWEEGLEVLKLQEAVTPVKTTAWSGATTIPMVLGIIRKVMPRLLGVRLLAQVQPIDRPTSRIFFLRRIRHLDGTDDSDIENRAGWSYRSWVRDPGEGETITTAFNLSLSSKDVSAISRKYLVKTTIEVEQDMRAYFGLDAFQLVSEAGAAELAAEIDERILHQLYHNRTGPLVQYGSAPAGFSGDNAAWDQRLVEAIQRASDLIYNKKRVRPNRLVVGSNFNVYLSRLRQYQAVVTDPLYGDQSLGVQMVGTLDNRFTVIHMPLPFPSNDCMLTYQGDNPLDGTFIWAPYVPLQQVGDTHVDPDTMRRTASWMRRDAEFIVDKGYVGIARVVEDGTITGLSYPAFTEYVGTWETSGGNVT